MEIKYCPKCHKEAYRIEKSDGGIKIIQRGKTVLGLSESSSASISFPAPVDICKDGNK